MLVPIRLKLFICDCIVGVIGMFVPFVLVRLLDSGVGT